MAENKFIIKNGVVVESSENNSLVFDIQGINRRILSINDNTSGEILNLSNTASGTAISVDSNGKVSFPSNILVTGATFMGSVGVGTIGTSNILTLRGTTSGAGITVLDPTDGSTHFNIHPGTSSTTRQMNVNFPGVTNSTDNLFVLRFNGDNNKWFFGDNGTTATINTIHDMTFSASGLGGAVGMTLLTNGNFGLGAITPDAKMQIHLNSSATAENQNSKSLSITSITSDNSFANYTHYGAYIAPEFNGNYNCSTGYGLYLNPTISGHDGFGTMYSFYNASVYNSYFNGNIGIGVVPAQQLDIYKTSGGSYWTEGLRVRRGANSTHYGIINYYGGALRIAAIVEGGSNNGEIYFDRHNAGSGTPTTSMMIDVDGNLGIGTINQIYRTEIKPATDTYSLALIQSDSTQAGWGFQADTSGNLQIARYNTSMSNKITISSTGAANFVSTVAATEFIENTVTLSSKYLGISATATDSSKLGGQLPSYYALSSALSAYLPLSGGELSSRLSLKNQGWLNLYNTANDHYISINYVDSLNAIDFYDRTSNVFAPIRAGGFAKQDSSSEYLLTGDGGHVATSTFALASSLSNYSLTSHNHSGVYLGVKLGYSANLNDALVEGTYYWAPTTLNRPDQSYGSILTIDGYGGWNNQLGFSAGGDVISHRQSINNNTSWSAWKTLYHSGNLLNIGTTASSARTALELTGTISTHNHNGTYALLAGSSSQPFSASSLSIYEHIYIKPVGGKVYFDSTGMGSSHFIGIVNDYDLRLYNGRGSSCTLDLLNSGTVSISGALAINGALSGATTGKFSGRLRFDGVNASEIGIEWYNEGAGKWLMYRAGASNDLGVFNWSIGGDALRFSYATNAATFSSSVSAASFTSGGNAVLHLGNYRTYTFGKFGYQSDLNSTIGAGLSYSAEIHAGEVNTLNRPFNYGGVISFDNGNMFSQIAMEHTTWGENNEMWFRGNWAQQGFTSWNKVWHTGNSNLTTIDWSAKNLTLAGSITGATTITTSGTITSSGDIQVNGANSGINWFSRTGSGSTFQFFNATGANLGLYNSVGGHIIQFSSSGAITLNGAVTSKTDDSHFRTGHYYAVSNSSISVGYIGSPTTGNNDLYISATNKLQLFSGGIGLLYDAGALSGATSIESKSGTIKDNNAWQTNFQIGNTSSGVAYQFLVGGSGNTNMGVGNFCLYGPSGNNLIINQSGAATFSSSVSATSFTASGGNSTQWNDAYFYRFATASGINIDDTATNYRGYLSGKGYHVTTGTFPAAMDTYCLVVNFPGDNSTNFQLGTNAGSDMYYRIKYGTNFSPWVRVYTAGNLTNTLTPNFLPYWNGSSLVNSPINSNGTNIGVGVDFDTSWKVKIKGRYPLTLINSDGNPKLELFADDNQLKAYGGMEIVGYSDLGSTIKFILNSATGAFSAASSITAPTITASTAMYSPGFFHSSDMRLKNVVKPLEDVLDKIRNFSTFLYTEKSRQDLGLQLGMSAQDFEIYFPTIVSKDELGYLGLQYPRISVIAIKAIQELDATQQEQSKTIQSLMSIQEDQEREITLLKGKLEQLEEMLRIINLQK